jgi:hypothetical protein
LLSRPEDAPKQGAGGLNKVEHEHKYKETDKAKEEKEEEDDEDKLFNKLAQSWRAKIPILQETGIPKNS